MSNANQFASSEEIQNAIYTLKGVIQGLDLDGAIECEEIDGLNGWVSLYQPYKDMHPFNELLPTLEKALEDGRIDKFEKADILWLCSRLAKESGFQDRVAGSLQEMQGVLAGILLDGEVKENEVFGLRKWLDKNKHLRTIWPYDEVDSLLETVLQDGEVSDEEVYILQNFFSSFLGLADDEPVSDAVDDVPFSLTGICATNPDIKFSDKTFSFTGQFTEIDYYKLVTRLKEQGATIVDDPDENTDYLVVGSGGNPCWAYACYGRKIEKAIEYRKSGIPLQIVHELDFIESL
ncbi:MAG: NAD-dependent DNA ligase [Gammaproteobacteria bacterium]|nr:MAG: NAD-dependent DNA ligase [Gammaproteobacteria bacterium]